MEKVKDACCYIYKKIIVNYDKYWLYKKDNNKCNKILIKQIVKHFREHIDSNAF